MSKNLLMHLSDTQTVLLFAFIGGYVDAAGYLKLKGVFTSSITGNLVIACTSVAKLEGVVSRAACSISFAFGAFMTNTLATKMKLSYKLMGSTIASVLVGLEAISFILCWIVGYTYNNQVDESDDIDSSYIVLMACLMGYTMGVQNGALREGFSGFPATTVMTSTLVNVSAVASQTGLLYLEYFGIIALSPTDNLTLSEIPGNVQTRENKMEVNTLSGDTGEGRSREKCNESMTQLILLGRPLIAFLIGSVVGAVLMETIEFHSMGIPLALVIFVVFEIVFKASQSAFSSAEIT